MLRTRARQWLREAYMADNSYATTVLGSRITAAERQNATRHASRSAPVSSSKYSSGLPAVADQSYSRRDISPYTSAELLATGNLSAPVFILTPATENTTPASLIIDQSETSTPVKSSKMSSIAPMMFPRDYYVLEITSETETRKFHISLNRGDTAMSAMEKIAESLNSAGMNVRASVQYNPATATAQLALESTDSIDTTKTILADTQGNLLDILGFRSGSRLSHSSPSPASTVNQEIRVNAFFYSIQPTGENQSESVQSQSASSGSPTFELYKRWHQNGKSLFDAIADALDHSAVTIDITSPAPAADQLATEALSSVVSGKESSIGTFLDEFFTTLNITTASGKAIEIRDGQLAIDAEKLIETIESNPERIQQVFTGPIGLAARAIFAARGLIETNALADSSHLPLSYMITGSYMDKNLT